MDRIQLRRHLSSLRTFRGNQSVSGSQHAKPRRVLFRQRHRRCRTHVTLLGKDPVDELNEWASRHKNSLTGGATAMNPDILLMSKVAATTSRASTPAAACLSTLVAPTDLSPSSLLKYIRT